MENIQAATLSLLQKKLEKEPDPPEITEQPEPQDAKPEDGGTPSDGSGETDGGIEQYMTEGHAPQSHKDAVARIAVAARYLRKVEPSSPVPYLLLRSLRWGELRAVTELTTLLTAPPTQLRTQMRRLATAGQWAELLDLTETAMAQECGRAWLDLQRYSVVACEKLGHAAVAKAIKSELKCLLTDFPALAKATLDDDTGTANPETMGWLQEQLQIK
jgi:type VI secretion system protein ImpA